MNAGSPAGPLVARLRSAQGDFPERFEPLLATAAECDPEVETAVREIVAAVRRDGVPAVLEYTRRFDGVEADALSDLRVPDGAFDAAWEGIGAGERAALAEAAARIRDYHERQRQDSWRYVDEDGSVLGQRITPLDRVGIYVPGGKACYPSSVLMNAIPARVAGVGRIVMTVPAPSGKLDPLVLAAARAAGIDEAWTIGGAQAIATLAFGAGEVRAVDKIVGPGNRYVAAAKRLVFGAAGIDMIAGPSEIAIVCDGNTPAEWIAMDLLSQAEHDEEARAILLSPDAAFLDRVEAAIESALPTLERAGIITRSLAAHGALIEVRDLEEALALANRPRARAPRTVGRGPGAVARCSPSCRGRLPRPPYPRGVRRLLRRPEPRPADRAHRAFLFAARGLRFPEAHERDRLLSPRGPASGGGRIDARARRDPDRPRALGRVPRRRRLKCGTRGSASAPPRCEFTLKVSAAHLRAHPAIPENRTVPFVADKGGVQELANAT